MAESYKIAQAIRYQTACGEPSTISDGGSNVKHYQISQSVSLLREVSDVAVS